MKELQIIVTAPGYFTHYELVKAALQRVLSERNCSSTDTKIITNKFTNISKLVNHFGSETGVEVCASTDSIDAILEHVPESQSDKFLLVFWDGVDAVVKSIIDLAKKLNVYTRVLIV